MDWQLPEYNLRMMLPEIFLFLWALAVMTFDVISRRRVSHVNGDTGFNATGSKDTDSKFSWFLAPPRGFLVIVLALSILSLLNNLFESFSRFFTDILLGSPEYSDEGLRKFYGIAERKNQEALLLAIVDIGAVSAWVLYITAGLFRAGRRGNSLLGLVLTPRQRESFVGYLSLLGLLITGLILSVTGYGRGFSNMFFNDPMALFFKIIFLGAAFMAIGSSFGITREKIVNHRGEYFGLILLSTVGMMFLASSNELLSLYIGLELTTIPLFVLAAFFKDNKLSVEAGLKYFVVGAFSSALLLYGISFLYGLSGTTELVQMKINIALTHLTFRNIGLILILSVVLIVAGIGFKLALPPFHQWAPDVYEGSPTPIAAFLSVGSKAAGVVAFAKIFVNGLSAFHGPEMAPNDWGKLVGLLACLAMIVGNVLAIRQSNIKRMLAYSSIAQAGYIMIGIVAMNELGLASVGFYVFAYLFANMGAFGIVAIFEDRTGSCQIASYSGLARTSPLLSGSMTVFLLSLAGIPPLAGFLAKYYVFASAIKVAGSDPSNSWMYWLVGVGLITAVFSLYYYANVIKNMYFVSEPFPYRVNFSAPAMSVIVIGLVGVFLFGLYPEPILQFASQIPLSFGFVPR